MKWTVLPLQFSISIKFEKFTTKKEKKEKVRVRWGRAEESGEGAGSSGGRRGRNAGTREGGGGVSQWVSIYREEGIDDREWGRE